MLVKEILCHYVLKSWKSLKSFWWRWSSISWRMCARACVCWSVVNGYTFAPQEFSERLDICPNTSSGLSWVSRTCCECWMVWTVSVLDVTWGGATSLEVSLLKRRMPQKTLLTKSSSVRSVAWKSNRSTRKCLNHAHKTTEISFKFHQTQFHGPATFSKWME